MWGRDAAQLPEWGWGGRKSYVYLEVPAAEQAVVEDERFVDQAGLGELDIRIPAYAH
jgi:hypothetical protein